MSQNLIETKGKNERKIFNCGLIMPISSNAGYPVNHWSQIRKILEEAINEITEFKFNVRMVSESESISIIQSTIIKNIYNDEIIICDVSTKNPNVMFELGMRLAFNKPVIIIKDCETDYSFDTSSIKHIIYPKTLNYHDILEFKNELKSYVIETYKECIGGSFNFLKEFGEFKAEKLENTKIDVSDIYNEIRELRKEIIEKKSDKNKLVYYKLLSDSIKDNFKDSLKGSLKEYALQAD
ncbi:hypothetical protein [Cetobacterium sp.]|uniref:hypothetical protein n=1 Tax=Cetobacterium sp. TaxID=2071632 RepID=UPI002FC9F218